MNNPGGKWSTPFQFVAGFGLVLAVAWLALYFWPKPVLSPGWQVIRPPQDVMALALYGNELWSGGRDGLYRIDLQSGVVLEKVRQPMAFSGVTALEATPDGALWVGHSRGVSRFLNGAWQTFNRQDGLPDNQVLALETNALAIGEFKNGLWAGTARGVALWDGAHWRTFPSPDGPGLTAVSVIYQQRATENPMFPFAGRVWFGDGFSNHGGLAYYDGGWHTVPEVGYLAHPMVNAILEDSQGRLWFATGFSIQGGATYLDGENWTSLGVEDGLAGARTRSIFQDATGTLWFGSEYDGISRYDGHSWQVLTPQDGMSGWEVKVMLQSPGGDLWFGTENGLTRLSPEAWQRLAEKSLILP